MPWAPHSPGPARWRRLASLPAFSLYCTLPESQPVQPALYPILYTLPHTLSTQYSTLLLLRTTLLYSTLLYSSTILQMAASSSTVHSIGSSVREIMHAGADVAAKTFPDVDSLAQNSLRHPAPLTQTQRPFMLEQTKQ